MKKTVLLLTGFMLLATTFVAAAPAANTISRPRIVSTAKNTTITYQGIKIFIPAGHTLVLGQSSDGSIILRGNNLQGIKIGDQVISSTGPVLLSVQPDTQVITVNRGTADIVNPVSAPAATAAANTTNHNTAAAEQAPTAAEDELPAFVAESEMSNTAAEQATQDVIETEEVLSPSAP